MSKLFSINLEEIAEQAVPMTVETPAEVEEPKVETELVVYCKIGYFEGLKEAVKKERHDQYEIKSSQEITGNKGCVRVRKTTGGDGVTYVLTNKLRSEDNNLNVSEEHDIDIPEEHFIAFSKIAPSKTIKDRFVFLVNNITVNKFGDETESIEVPELKFEVDVFPKEEGGYHEWCKIDIEIDPLLKIIDASEKDIKDFKLNIKVNHLPFKPTDAFVGSEATEEQQVILDKFYSEIFFVKI